jgi:FkbM family methyltransferase
MNRPLGLLKRTVKNAAKTLGYTIIPNWRLERYSSASYLQKLLDFLEIDCILDVGANIGQYRGFLRNEVGYDGIIVSFEPIAQHAEVLRRSALSDKKWIINEYALGDSPGSKTFNIMANTVFSSFLEPDHSKVNTFRAMNVVTHRVEIQMRTLDEVLPELEAQVGKKNLYLKLDTQGFDLEVMHGAGRCIDSIRALQTEASVTPIYSQMPNYATSIRTLQDLGFELSGIFPNNPGHFPALIEFDCFMIAARYLPKAITEIVANV